MQKQHPKFGLIYLLSIATVFLTMSGCSLDLARQAEDKEQAAALSDELQPNPDLSPDDVIRIQVEALQYNNTDDQGIEVTFRFASPANQRVTGPLNRFKHLLKSPDYRPMLNHKTAEYGSLEISGDIASQRVTIIQTDGKATVYLFKLSKQSEGPCTGCWMTDSVLFVPTQKQNLQGA